MFDEKDKAFHKGLMKLLDEASFDLKAREVRAFLAVYDWAKNLPEKFKEEKPPVKKKTRKKTDGN